MAGALHLVGDLSGTRELAEKLVQVYMKYEFAIPRAVGNFLLGATRASDEDFAAALILMEPTFEATLGYGFLAMLPAIMKAETLVRSGRDKDALALLSPLLDEL